jgi:predicted HTH domain antitoxin
MDVRFNIPKEILPKVGADEAAFARYARGLAALDLYKNKGVPLGFCAEVAEMSVEAFVFYLGENRVSVFNFESAEAFAEEARNA